MSFPSACPARGLPASDWGTFLQGWEDPGSGAVFLMLREFGLLNSFWALILPELAHGYPSFLLKGFFASLPRELYESAQIDGAGEFRIFWQSTISLSQPILAVIALQAFTAAYPIL